MNQQPFSGDNPELGVALTSISPTDKPWDIHRVQSSELAALYQLSTFPQYGERINACSLRLGFALLPLPDDNGTLALKLREARFCRVRHCPICQWRRSLMWRARFFKKLPKILEDYPSHRFIFLTLTVRNCELSNLRATITHMNESFKRLTKLTVWPGVGWVKCLEVTRSTTDLAHPHFHCLVMVKSSYFSGAGYLKQQTWRELWQQSLRVEYLPIVNVKAIYGKPGPKQPALIKAVTETVKYSIKPGDLLDNLKEGESPLWLNGITEQLQNVRAIGIGGVFKGYLSEKEEPKSLIRSEGESENPSSEADPKIFFGWREKYLRYLQEGC